MHQLSIRYELKCCMTGLDTTGCYCCCHHAMGDPHMQQQNRVTFYRNASFFCLHFGFVETAKLFGTWFGLFEMKLSLACFMAFHVHKIEMYTQEKCVSVKKDSIVTKSMSKVHIITLFRKNSM